MGLLLEDSGLGVLGCGGRDVIVSGMEGSWEGRELCYELGARIQADEED